MLHIKKGSPPKIFTEFILHNPTLHFDDMPSDVKHSLREALLLEQGHLCAYCMTRIDSDNTKIEHYIPRNSDNELDYKNLLAVCRGNEGQPRRAQHCDTRKGNSTLHLDPQQAEHIAQLHYKSDGTIFSKSNSAFEHDLNSILNLNDPFGYLKHNRKHALDTLKFHIRKKLGDRAASTSFLQRALDFFSANSSGERKPYCGILIDYLQQRIRSSDNINRA